MTILFILSTLSRTGPVNLTYDVIRYLPKDKFRVQVLTLSSEKNSSRWQDFVSLDGVEVHSLQLNRWKAIWQSGRQLKDFCRVHQPDVIQSQGIRSDILSSFFLKKNCKVYNIQNFAFDDYPMLYGKLGYPMAFFHLWCLKNEEMLVACSKHIALKLSKHVNTKVEVVQNGTVEGFEMSTRVEKHELVSNLNIKADQKVFLFAGSLIHRKNPMLIIKAFLELNRPDIFLLILGDGPLKSQCENLIGSNSNVKLMGQVTNVASYMKISRFYVSASLSEGLPTAVLEGLNHGLPALLSNIPQHAEVLEDFSNAGVLFKENDLEDLKHKIEVLVAAPYDKMQKAALESISLKFNSRRMSEEFQALYCRIASNC